MGVLRIGLAVFAGVLIAGAIQPVWGQTASGTLTTQSPALTAEEASALKNPVPFTTESIAAGKQLYLFHNCAACHGPDGKALIDVIANATDLTEPKFWNNGTEPGQIFKSLRDGAAVTMPPYKGKISKETDLWNLVNFIQSLWPADRQPAKQP
jgi:mono/diheme cytochrome c family protein